MISEKKKVILVITYRNNIQLIYEKMPSTVGTINTRIINTTLRNYYYFIILIRV